MANEATPYFDPGDAITAYCEAAVTGKRFVAISGPLVDGLPQVSPAGAGARVWGVAQQDAAIGAKVGVLREGVLPVTAGEALTAGWVVTSDAAGRAVRADTNNDVICGVVIDDVANGADAPIDFARVGAGKYGVHA